MRFSKVHLEFGWAILSGIVRGRLSFPGGHRPVAGHTVSDAFVGVGVAAAEDPAVDDYILERLREAGIRHVRLDFSPGDQDKAAGRLLSRLIADDLKVTLHLVQSFDDAKRMPAQDVSETWRVFVTRTLDRYGSAIEIVEAGSTTNRKRWAGHSIPGFLAMWEIVWRETRARGLTLAGPSITDFEPLWNIGLLALLCKRGQLPDLHTDNLFAERCTEPERYDHKILGRALAPWIKFNLIKKARLLARIGAEYGVPRLFSPSAFWTLPRIERLLPDSEQKQADYLARYLVLCAASGALERAWWGPLICHREGLIDNGKRPYPALERITRYTGVEGSLGEMRERPAFFALCNFVSLLRGACYQGRKNASDGLEVHAFRSAQAQVHVAWTVNGKAAALVDIYEPADLAAAQIVGRDGCAIEQPCAGLSLIVCESPIFLQWPSDRAVSIKPDAMLLRDLAVACHASEKTHYFFRDEGWQGIVLAHDSAEAAVLMQTIHPDSIGSPVQETTLRHARNAIWMVDDPREEGRKLVVKQPVKMHLHKRLLDRFKPSKALRSWNGSNELLRRGIMAAPPVAYFERCGESGVKNNYYLCEYVQTDSSVREMVLAFARGETAFRGVPEREAYRQLADYLLAMHGRGIFFRDLSGGNILVDRLAEDVLKFVLIDTGRIHAYNCPLSLGKRVSDLVRVCNKMNRSGRQLFLDRYMTAIGRRLSWWGRLAFDVYDLKVVTKRKLGRKAIKRLGRFCSQR